MKNQNQKKNFNKKLKTEEEKIQETLENIQKIIRDIDDLQEEYKKLGAATPKVTVGEINQGGSQAGSD